MYEQYVSDPGSVDPTWAEYFKTHQLGGATNRSTGNGPTANGSTGPAAKPAAPAAPPKAAAAPAKQTAPPPPAPSGRAQPAADTTGAPAAKRPATVERPTTT